MNEEGLVKEVSSVVHELTFKDRLFSTLKKLLLIFAVLILLFKFIKWVLNNVRKSWQLQLADNSWGTILWIKFWGIVIGVLLYHYGIVDIVFDWILNLGII